MVTGLRLVGDSTMYNWQVTVRFKMAEKNVTLTEFRNSLIHIQRCVI